jgi:type II secretory pathway pseudopilin PulG
MRINNIQKNKGMTLVELLIVAAIFILIVIALGYFQSDVFKLNRTLQIGLDVQQNANKILRPFAAEVRSATISNIGGFPIEKAATTTMIFYSDIDDDGLKDRIRYFVEDDQFKKGTIVPDGDPFFYDPADEKVKIIARRVVPDEIVFEYYDDTYNGSASSTPLTYPMDLTEITLVKAKLLIDASSNGRESIVEISTQAMFRNLKDN